MIDDLDRTIQILLEQELSRVLAGPVTISFAAPDSDFPSSSDKLPAVDLFLYDVRENTELRNTQWLIDRNLDGSATRRRAPVRVDCSYLITAWVSDPSSSRPVQEHRLLSEVMKSLLRYPILPEGLLQGNLKGQEPPLPATALQPGRLHSVAEFWQALGGKPKAALNYTVTVAIGDDWSVDAEIPVTERVLEMEARVERTR
jgi:hypothetical protein